MDAHLRFRLAEIRFWADRLEERAAELDPASEEGRSLAASLERIERLAWDLALRSALPEKYAALVAQGDADLARNWRGRNSEAWRRRFKTIAKKAWKSGTN